MKFDPDVSLVAIGPYIIDVAPCGLNNLRPRAVPARLDGARAPNPPSGAAPAVDTLGRGSHSDFALRARPNAPERESETRCTQGTRMTRASTVGQLRASGYQLRSVKQELRDNRIARLRAGTPLFAGIVGYEESVVPQIENAILSGQDIVFLGERGQAKTRMARLLIELLDDAVPALSGCEINDDPRAPICHAWRARIAEVR